MKVKTESKISSHWQMCDSKSIKKLYIDAENYNVLLLHVLFWFIYFLLLLLFFFFFRKLGAFLILHEGMQFFTALQLKVWQEQTI